MAAAAPAEAIFSCLKKCSSVFSLYFFSFLFICFLLSALLDGFEISCAWDYIVAFPCLLHQYEVALMHMAYGMVRVDVISRDGNPFSNQMYRMRYARMKWFELFLSFFEENGLNSFDGNMWSGEDLLDRQKRGVHVFHSHVGNWRTQGKNIDLKRTIFTPNSNPNNLH